MVYSLPRVYFFKKCVFKFTPFGIFAYCKSYTGPPPGPRKSFTHSLMLMCLSSKNTGHSCWWLRMLSGLHGINDFLPKKIPFRCVSHRTPSQRVCILEVITDFIKPSVTALFWKETQRFHTHKCFPLTFSVHDHWVFIFVLHWFSSLQHSVHSGHCFPRFSESWILPCFDFQPKVIQKRTDSFGFPLILLMPLKGHSPTHTEVVPPALLLPSTSTLH